jgi:hypothetical protein
VKTVKKVIKVCACTSVFVAGQIRSVNPEHAESKCYVQFSKDIQKTFKRAYIIGLQPIQPMAGLVVVINFSGNSIIATNISKFWVL